jgi:hypothetical protein
MASSGPSDLQLDEERRQRRQDGQDYGPYYGYGTGADPLLQPTIQQQQQQQG